MKSILDRAKHSFEDAGTIKPVLETINDKAELDELQLSVKGKHGAFFKLARTEIVEFGPGLRQRTRFNSRVDLIEDFICTDHILRNGDLTKKKFHDLSRGLAIGGVRELPLVWTGLVSKDAWSNAEWNISEAKNNSTKHRLSQMTFLKATPGHGVRNSTEHFYNNQYAAAVILAYKLYFDDDRKVLEDICNVCRQVHITTAKENLKLSHNGQNAEDRMGWKEAYASNNIKLIDAKVKPVEVLSIKDVVPDGLIEMVMDLRVGWKD